MITITPFAAVNLRRMVSDLCNEGDVANATKVGGPEGQEGFGLRISVEKGGCAGMQYTMKLDRLSPDDEVNECDGALVFVGHESAQFIHGSELDYCDDLTGTGFRLKNPNASRSCGCGTSFEPVSSEGVPGSAVTHSE